MTKRRGIGPLLLAAVVSFASFEVASQEQNPEATVRDRELAFARSMQNRSLAEFSEFIAEDAVFFTGELPTRGREAIVSAWAPFFQSREAPFSWAPDVVAVLDSGDLALSSGPVTLPNGEQSGRFNSIWRKEPDGVWRVVFDKGS